MQQCGICLKIYDESEFSHCPYCSGELYEDDEYDFEDEEEDEEDTELDESTIQFIKVLNTPGIFDDEGEWVRCPICGTGLHVYDGTKTCPRCGPID